MIADYNTFYDLAEYGNKMWRGSFTPKEVANNAYEYFCEYSTSIYKGEATHTMSELYNLLVEDGSEDVEEWLELLERIPGLKKEKITKEMAKEFYRDLCGTVYGDANKNCGGVMSVALIADHMKISIEKANAFCDAMIEYRITERSNGMIIV